MPDGTNSESGETEAMPGASLSSVTVEPSLGALSVARRLAVTVSPGRTGGIATSSPRARTSTSVVPDT